MNTPLWQTLQAALQQSGSRIVLDDGTHRYQADELLAAVDAAASALAAYRVVALAADNGCDWVIADLAALQAGVTLVPLPLFFSPAQQAHVLASSKAELLLQPIPGAPLFPGCRTLGATVLQPDATGHSDSAKITFTSGTTGAPKGVCLSQTLLLATTRALLDASGGASLRSHLAVLPLSTLLENVAGVYRALLAGACCHVPPLAQVGLSGSSGFDVARLCRALDTYTPASLILVPQLLGELVAAAQAGWQVPASLRFVAVGGARVAPRLVEHARALGLPVYEGYGLSECGSVVCLNTPEQDRPGSVGRVLPHVSVEVVNDELVITLPDASGYLGDPASFSTCVKSGDRVRIDADGFVHVNGRSKHLLITAFGRNVSPEWVESELLAQGVIRQCVVLGEALPALVALVFAPGADDQHVQQALDHASLSLPDYARVAHFIRLETPLLPGSPLMTDNGRPRRALIAEHYAAALAALTLPRTGVQA
ncbi:AMP-binding protein [Craterilacuibacter sinensis]|uniref:AMP-binding protein n=1 Tax=Craterilacuibacter sinensis TaxID=2686017 RepID=A0A845BU45_9NEIS|nr:AMP-binding protein [Craterilacuibacter sinensis]MXR37686.1 AMP-binding protein [Craterilacuibacter sinensis]RQW23886.1 long-chain acyl-CoA synthetase [Rhodobacteraceae bacterium CH30]